MPRPLWSVVLAGGAGRRLLAVTHGTPKQYWRADGRRSLLEETVARLAPLGAVHTSLVVDRAHEQYLRDTRCGDAAVLYQPADRGTAAGVFFGLSPVLEHDPEAFVLVTPSDHGIRQTSQFRHGVLSAVASVQRGFASVVMFGVAPAEPSADFGWILPGARMSAHTTLQQVTAFVEKPPLPRAAELFAAGAVWNTMVVVARASALADLFERHAAPLAALFAEYRRRPATGRDAWLADRYADLGPVDFSRDILAPARGLAVATWPASIGWADLGTPDRLRQWWAGARPADAAGARAAAPSFVREAASRT